MKHKAFNLASFKALDQAQGTFEAIVAVFNNVDRIGDRILPGAFAKSLEGWKTSGEPIPVIFAHEWDNLDAHIGEVLEAKEVPEGLYVKGQLEMDEPFAQRVWKKMQKRTLRQFSFAYDVVVSELVDGVNDLKELELMEVGPCLVGMNPDTELLGVKEGRRNATADQGRIQKIHDLAVEAGAKCSQPEGTAEDEAGDLSASGGAQADGKSSSKSPSTLAERVALELALLGVD